MNLPVNDMLGFYFFAAIETLLVFSEDILRFIAAVSFVSATAQL
jgi:hypothetical protein